jgi:hypothetical protein
MFETKLGDQNEPGLLKSAQIEGPPFVKMHHSKLIHLVKRCCWIQNLDSELVDLSKKTATQYVDL